MEINITTPGLLFPAITLLMLAYTQRFLGIASTIRILNEKYSMTDDKGLLRQIANLKLRITLIKIMQVFGVISILCCFVSMMCMLAGYTEGGRTFFAISLVLMVASLLISLWEILLSGEALNVELENLKNARKYD